MPIYNGDTRNKIPEVRIGNKISPRGYRGDTIVYQYDSVAPTLTVTAPTGTSTADPSYTTSASYTVSGTVEDADSGVAAVYVNGSKATISGTSWTYSLTLTGNSTTTIRVYAVDNAGNATDTIIRYVMYDTAAPTLTVTQPTSTSASSPTYTPDSTYTVSGTASDSGSGIQSVTVNGNVCTGTTSWSYDLSLSGDVTTTITIVATDNAGRTTTATRYLMYDSTVPTLSVTAPTGTSSSSPTYKQSDSSTSYTVSGTASDTGSGIASVTVNGYTASGTTSWSYSLSSLATNTTHTITIVATDNAGRTTTVTRYLRIEAYYQYAARTAGATVQSSLANTLTNSSVCEAIAGNSTAYTAMKNNYASNMRSYITSNFSTGLNNLNAACGLDYYIQYFNNVNNMTSFYYYRGYSTNSLTSSGYYVHYASESAAATGYVSMWRVYNSKGKISYSTYPKVEISVNNTIDSDRDGNNYVRAYLLNSTSASTDYYSLEWTDYQSYSSKFGVSGSTQTISMTATANYYVGFYSSISYGNNNTCDCYIRSILVKNS